MDYLTNQPIWFSGDNSNVWQPGYVRCQDLTTPDTYWISTQSNRTLRRNVHGLKPRFPTAPGALTSVLGKGNGDLVTPSSVNFQHCAPHAQVSPVEPRLPTALLPYRSINSPNCSTCSPNDIFITNCSTCSPNDTFITNCSTGSPNDILIFPQLLNMFPQ